MSRARPLLMVAVALATAAIAFTPTSSAVDADPGDVELVNLEHVDNFPFGEPGTDQQATDLDFWTAEVVLRDADGTLVDADGAPLPAGAEPVVGERRFVAVGDRGTGGHLIDITDPEDAFETALVECPHSRNDAAVTTVDTDDGPRVLLALSKEGGSSPCIPFPSFGERGRGGAAVFDITDPYDPFPLFSLEAPGGAHNVTFHPTAPYLYISTGDLPGAINHIPVFDVSDLDLPELVADPEIEGGPHDIEFSPDGSRAYVASENNHQIWDTSDPAAPSQISATPNVGTYAHGLFASPDGRYMLANNESLALGGFFAPNSAVCPGEGLMVYDIEDETTPVPVGYMTADVQGPVVPADVGLDSRACTSHFGNVGESGRVITVGWYIGGTRIFDFSDPAQPEEIAAAVLENTEVWSARTNGDEYVYVGDVRRGLDIFKWDGDGPAPWLVADDG